jgi:hypothetical protein
MICSDCGKHFEVGDWPFPCAGLGHEPGSFWTGDAQVHTTEKVVVYQDGQGNIRVPGRGDRPIHPKLAAAGFERRELNSISQVREVEKKTGLIHERSNYDLHSARADRDTGS